MVMVVAHVSAVMTVMAWSRMVGSSGPGESAGILGVTQSGANPSCSGSVYQACDRQ